MSAQGKRTFAVSISSPSRWREALARFHLPGPDPAQDRDCQDGRNCVKDRDNDKHGCPAAGCLLQEGGGRTSQDRTDALRDVKETIIGRGKFRSERIGQRGREERKDFAPT